MQTTTKLALAILIIHQPLLAESRDDFWTFGVQMDGSNVYFEDHEGEGSASTFNELNALKLKLITDIDRDTRAVSALSYRSFNIDPDLNVVGQDAKLLSLETIYQEKFNFGRSAFIWAGIGGGATQYSYSDRFKVDQEGYTTREYEDLNGVGFYALASVGREFPIATDWLLGIQAQYEYHFGGNLRATSIGLSILYD